MRLRFVFTMDITGMTPDNSIVLELKPGTCIQCYSTDVLYNLLKKHLDVEDYEYLHLWKVFVE